MCLYSKPSGFLQALIYYVTNIYTMRMCPDDIAHRKINANNISELISQCSDQTIRYGNDMKGYYAEEPESEEIIYEVFELKSHGHIRLDITRMNPGKVGNEYYMTKGHFHEDNLAGEVYFGLKGEGIILLQTAEGDTEEAELKPGFIVNIPPKWAHRSVNVGDDELIFLAVYPETAGHDYETIERQGFKKRVIEVDGAMQIVE